MSDQNEAASEPSAGGNPKRIWPTLLAALLTPVFAALQVGTGLELLAPGREPQSLIATPLIGFVGLGLLQLSFILCSLLVAQFSREEPGDRLATRWPHVAPLSILILALAAYGVDMLTSTLGAPLLPNLDDSAAHLDALLQPSSGWIRVGLIAIIVVVTPLATELFCRGLLLHGLLRRLAPVAAILLTACLFVLPLGEWQGQLLALPLGLYLGAVAYRTRSIWPGVFGQIYLSLVPVLDAVLPEPLKTTLMRPQGVWSVFDYAGAIALPLACWLLWRGVALRERESDLTSGEKSAAS